MREILGNKKGIRDSVLNELIALYDVQVPLGQLISAELALKLADITEFINREISLYISRSGQITNIVIGGNDSVEHASSRRSQRYWQIKWNPLCPHSSKW